MRLSIMCPFGPGPREITLTFLPHPSFLERWITQKVLPEQISEVLQRLFTEYGVHVDTSELDEMTQKFDVAHLHSLAPEHRDRILTRRALAAENREAINAYLGSLRNKRNTRADAGDPKAKAQRDKDAARRANYRPAKVTAAAAGDKNAQTYLVKERRSKKLRKRKKRAEGRDVQPANNTPMNVATLDQSDEELPATTTFVKRKPSVLQTLNRSKAGTASVNPTTSLLGANSGTRSRVSPAVVLDLTASSTSDKEEAEEEGAEDKEANMIKFRKSLCRAYVSSISFCCMEMRLRMPEPTIQF